MAYRKASYKKRNRTNDWYLRKAKTLHYCMRVIQVNTLMADPSEIASQNEGIFRICITLDEVEFGNEGMFDPIGKKLGHKDDATHAHVLHNFGNVHHATLEAVQNENEEKE